MPPWPQIKHKAPSWTHEWNWRAQLPQEGGVKQQHAHLCSVRTHLDSLMRLSDKNIYIGRKKTACLVCWECSIAIWCVDRQIYTAVHHVFITWLDMNLEVRCVDSESSEKRISTRSKPAVNRYIAGKRGNGMAMLACRSTTMKYRNNDQMYCMQFCTKSFIVWRGWLMSLVFTWLFL